MAKKNYTKDYSSSNTRHVATSSTLVSAPWTSCLASWGTALRFSCPTPRACSPSSSNAPPSTRSCSWTATSSWRVARAPRSRVRSLTRFQATSGEPGDADNFSEMIKANMKLYSLRNATQLTTHAAAHFTRGELATALRKARHSRVASPPAHARPLGAASAGALPGEPSDCGLGRHNRPVPLLYGLHGQPAQDELRSTRLRSVGRLSVTLAACFAHTGTRRRFLRAQLDGQVVAAGHVGGGGGGAVRRRDCGGARVFSMLARGALTLRRTGPVSPCGGAAVVPHQNRGQGRGARAVRAEKRGGAFGLPRRPARSAFILLTHAVACRGAGHQLKLKTGRQNVVLFPSADI